MQHQYKQRHTWYHNLPVEKINHNRHRPCNTAHMPASPNLQTGITYGKHQDRQKIGKNHHQIFVYPKGHAEQKRRGIPCKTENKCKFSLPFPPYYL